MAVLVVCTILVTFFGYHIYSHVREMVLGSQYCLLYFGIVQHGPKLAHLQVRQSLGGTMPGGQTASQVMCHLLVVPSMVSLPGVTQVITPSTKEKCQLT